jgi:cation-transporting ATPase 13A1
LKDLVPLISVFARHAPHQKEAVVAAFNHGGYHTLMCGDGTNDVGALKRAHVGISIISAPEVEAKQRKAAKKMSKLKKSAKRNGTATRARPTNNAWEESLHQLQEAQEELDNVELGDASVAAPFTSRAVSIKCCKDVIQQGRCTLVTMLQIYKILGVNCLVNAMVLSKLFLHGVKQGDRQLTVLGLGVAALFFFVSRAEPLPTLSHTRPPVSVLSRQALLSIGLQFAVHIVTILLATETSLRLVDPYDPSLVPDGPFNPNVLNTCTFLLTCVSTINTFAVNYRGRPFMQDLRENRMLYRSLQLSYLILALSVWEVFPPLNDLLQLTALPNVTELLTLQEGGSNSVGVPLPWMPLIQTVGFPAFLSGLMVVDTVLAFQVESMVLRYVPD